MMNDTTYLFQAQESPEPVYDLSECALKAVPSGVYSRCKVSRKEGLMLHVSLKLQNHVLRPINRFFHHPVLICCRLSVVTLKFLFPE
jgi:hypothetical protein